MARIGGLADESHAQRQTYTPPADGWVHLQVVDSGGPEQVKNKPTDEYYWFECEILDDGDDKGKKFRHICVTQSANEKTQGGGLFNLNQLCKAVGMSGYSEMNDTDEVHFIPFEAEIKSTPQKNNKDFFNTNIRAWGFEEEAKGDTPSEKAEPSSARSTNNGGSGATKGGASAGADWRNKARG